MNRSPQQKEDKSAKAKFQNTVSHVMNSKHVYFYKDNDPRFPGLRLSINPRHHRNFDALLTELTPKVPGLSFGVRTIYTPGGHDPVHSIDELKDDGHYICSTNRYARGLDLNHLEKQNKPWHGGKPPSGRLKFYAQQQTSPNQPKRRFEGSPSQVFSPAKPPKKFTVVRNGDPTVRYTILLNRRTAQSYEQVLDDLSDRFREGIRLLYTLDGKQVRSLSAIFNGPDLMVAAHGPPLKPMPGLSPVPENGSKPSTNRRITYTGDSHIGKILKDKRERVMKTRGKWKIWVTTNELPTSGTRAQVTLTVYGTKANSGPIPLGIADGSTFQSAHVDEFEWVISSSKSILFHEKISVGTIGDIYKIRISHDNTGDYSGWYLDEVRMRDMHTEEELTFICKRWLSKDEDDGEVVRELPVIRPGQPVLSITKYNVTVYTGDLYNAGTSANVYLTLYGERGDTGVRHLCKGDHALKLVKGQSESFSLEAVSLGAMKRAIIGHDGIGSGAGWYLDRIIVYDQSIPKDKYVFLCRKWLDEGEDDGKIVRELKAQDSYVQDLMEKQMWEYEKWKYQKGNHVMFYAKSTQKSLRLKGDGSVDGRGEANDPRGVYSVLVKRGMVRVFKSVENEKYHLSIDGNKVMGLGKGGAYCEFNVRIQDDRSVVLESVKHTNHHISVQENGRTGETKGSLLTPNKQFFCYCKGLFRKKGTVMFFTSLSQTMSSDHENSLYGTGKANKLAHFKVHKVSEGGVRKFESVVFPGQFIQLKEGRVDIQGTGDGYCHFVVTKYKDLGYITLESANNRGLFIGITAEGQIRPTVDTGDKNVRFYPEVVEFGKQKLREPQVDILSIKSPDPEPIRMRHKQKKDEVDEDYSDGDMKLWVSTTKSLQEADVMLVVYGDKGLSGPILLGGSDNHNIFQRDSKDLFKINLLNVGEVYKVRMQLHPTLAKEDSNPSWTIKEIKVQDIETRDTLKFKFNTTLSRQTGSGDLVKEVAAVRPRKPLLPTYKYQVYVYTGVEPGADTDANVYVTIFGERGDTGKRVLLKSNNKDRFQEDQVDIFELEAVSLGQLKRISVSHDGRGAGEGWFCEKIVVRESPDSEEEYVFPCHRWFDTSMDDRRIERVLKAQGNDEEDDHPETPKTNRVLVLIANNEEKEKSEVKDETDEEKEDEPKESEGIYQLWIKTANDSKEVPKDAKIVLTLYGDKGKSNDIILPQKDDTSFESNSTDIFEISTGALGDIYKVRVGQVEDCIWEAWHLDEIKMEDKNTGEVSIFTFDRWMSRSMDDKDVFREMAVLKDDKQSMPLQTYTVNVHTGNHWAAETDADVYVTLLGTRGDSGRRLLYHSTNNAVRFRRKQVDSFEVEAVDLEHVTSVVIGHNSKGHGAGIFIDKVTVTEKEGDNDDKEFVFPCGRWLDDHMEDGLTERQLKCVDVLDKNRTQVKTDPSIQTQGEWQVSVKTSDVHNGRTLAKVYVTVYGNNGRTGKIHLGEGMTETDLFEQGKESQFLINVGDIGNVEKIHLEHDNSQAFPQWHVDWVKMSDLHTKQELVFYVNRWLALTEDDHEICRELPVVTDDVEALPVHHYFVSIKTGNISQADTRSPISLAIYGEKGDTGSRPLRQSMANKLSWQQGQTDVFVVSAVSLGKLERIALSLELKDRGDSWYVDDVIIKENQYSIEEYVFPCKMWLDSKTNTREFMLRDTRKSSQMPRLMNKSRYIDSAGLWELSLTTGVIAGKETTAKIDVFIYGLDGCTALTLNDGDDCDIKKDHKEVYEINIDDIGDIFKVSFKVRLDEKVDWMLNKVKLKHKKNGTEYNFAYDDWIRYSDDDDPDCTVDLPVIKPDVPPLTEKTYMVTVNTGRRPAAETSADVYLALIGQWGDSTKRTLGLSHRNDQAFRSGQTDVFHIQTLDIGDISSVLVGHHSTGKGAGWFCDSVVVQELAEDAKTQIVFPCHRWLDSSCEDGSLERLLSSTGEIVIPKSGQEILEPSGEWRCWLSTGFVDMADDDDDDDDDGDYKKKKKKKKKKPASPPTMASLVVYGEDGNSDVLPLKNKDGSPLIMNSVYEFDIKFENVGDFIKLRLTQGDDNDKYRWIITKFKMEDRNTKDVTMVDFNCWLGNKEELTHELPVLKYGYPILPVLTYLVKIRTSDADDASTYSNIAVNLSGSKGTTGMRPLNASTVKNAIKFQKGKVDVFELMAVDIGEIDQITVTKGPGDTWKIKDIVLSTDYNAQEWIFEHDSWIGSKDIPNESTTVELSLTDLRHQEEPEEHDLASSGKWHVYTRTSKEGGAGTNSTKVFVTMCGTNGESQPLTLLAEDDTTPDFKEGCTDKFEINVEDEIGQITKVRLDISNTGAEPSWLLDSIRCVHEKTRAEFSYDYKDWIRVNDECDGVVDIPAIWPKISNLHYVKYQVEVYTGDVSGAGTDATVYLILDGEAGSTGKRVLKKSKNTDTKFEQGQMNLFEIEAVSVSRLQRAIIGHDGKGMGSGWFLDKVVVSEDTNEDKYEFPCNRWFDEGEDDGKIEREILVAASGKQSGLEWEVTAYTGNDKNDTTTTPVTMVIYGNKGHSDVTLHKDGGFSYGENAQDLFTVKTKDDVGEPYKIRVGFEDISSSPQWYLKKINLKNTKLGKEVNFELNGWVWTSGEQDCWREIAADSDTKLKVYKYQVEVYTGTVDGSGTDANVYIQLVGERGDSGTRNLKKSLNNDSKFESGKMDLFEMETVDLGSLKSVKVGHDGAGFGAGWFLQKLHIKESSSSSKTYVFNCDRWLDEGEDDHLIERILELTEVKENTDESPNDGDWTVAVITSPIDNSGTDAKVMLTIFGDKGSSEPLPLGEPGNKLFEQGNSDSFPIKLDKEQVGTIQKIRLEHDNSGKAPGWHVSKVILEDLVSGTKLEFPLDRWLDATEDDGATVRELAASIDDNNESLKSTKYTVQTYTGDKVGAGTDSEVYLRLFGEKWDTGKRYLRKNAEDNDKFESGKIDKFDLEAIGLGVLKKIVIGHDGKGSGSGWFLDKVTVTSVDESSNSGSDTKEYIFKCDRWLDEDEDDKKIELELFPNE